DAAASRPDLRAVDGRSRGAVQLIKATGSSLIQHSLTPANWLKFPVKPEEQGIFTSTWVLNGWIADHKPLYLRAFSDPHHARTNREFFQPKQGMEVMRCTV